jgi:hypothetical protein
MAPYESRMKNLAILGAPDLDFEAWVLAQTQHYRKSKMESASLAVASPQPADIF